MAVAVLSLALAALLGFAVHRGSVCMVKGVAEVLSTGRAHMLLGFGKTIVWVLIVTSPVLWLAHAPASFRPHLGRVRRRHGRRLPVRNRRRLQPRLRAVHARPDRQRRGERPAHARRLCARGGRDGGRVGPLGVAAAPASAGAGYDPLDPTVSAVVALLALWGAWELARLWRSRSPDAPWRGMVLAGSYRLSSAAVLIGVASGTLFALHGPWSYMHTLDRTVVGLSGA